MFVEECDIILHVSHAATTGASALCGESFGNSVIFEDGLDRSLAQAENLSLGSGHQFSRVEGKALFYRHARDDEGDAERALTAEKLMR